MDLVAEFYTPCLREAVRYDRAVGYFTSGSLHLVARGLMPFIRSGGKMRLIASPYLDEADERAIEEGYERRDAIVSQRLCDAIDAASKHKIPRHRLQLLAWMVAHSLLDIKIAVPKRGVGRGLYHEKLGVFADHSGDFVAFTGSANETTAGLSENFEQVDVFQSWSAPVAVRAVRKRDHFERLWLNHTATLDVFDFPDAPRQLLAAHQPDRLPECEEGGESSIGIRGALHLPTDLQLRDYQQEAIRAWFRSGGRGMFEMATGTGKTHTALALAVKLAEQLSSLCLIVVCPYIHLTEQWARTAREYGFEPVLCHESRRTWTPPALQRLGEFLSGSAKQACFVVTSATFSADAFQGLIEQVPRNSLLIGDECHNLGASGHQRCLPSRIAYRLGLSATPERWFDEEGSQRLRDYFGDVVFKFDLRSALESGCLTRYRYHPILVSLTPDEDEQYHALSAQIAKLGFSEERGEDRNDSPLSHLLRKRARLVGAAAEKLPRLRALLEDRPFTSHALFYCGDGRVESALGDEEMRQVDAIVELLGQGLGYRVHRFTAGEDRTTREHILKEFEAAQLQALVAIRCLDEGVDVPATREAYILASTSNPRQAIQRLGRILRRADGKEYASIYDFVVVPSDDPGYLPDEVFNVERRLLKKELTRARQFASLATNGPDAMRALLPLQSRYQLLSE